MLAGPTELPRRSRRSDDSLRVSVPIRAGRPVGVFSEPVDFSTDLPVPAATEASGGSGDPPLRASPSGSHSWTNVRPDPPAPLLPRATSDPEAFRLTRVHRCCIPVFPLACVASFTLRFRRSRGFLQFPGLSSGFLCCPQIFLVVHHVVHHLSTAPSRSGGWDGPFGQLEPPE